MQQPMNPTIDAIPATNKRPKITNGCFNIIAKLELIASTAFSLAKIISGIVNTVKNDITRLINEPSSIIPAYSKAVAKPDVTLEISNMAIKSSLK